MVSSETASDFIKYFVLRKEDDTDFYQMSSPTVVLVFGFKYAALCSIFAISLSNIKE